MQIMGSAWSHFRLVVNHVLQTENTGSSLDYCNQVTS